MAYSTILVGTDLADRSNTAILRGHEIALANNARLVICHVAPSQMGNHPLFPQRYEQDLLSASNLDQQIADAVSTRVTELTSREPGAFEVVIDQGEPARVLMDNAERISADLTVVMADVTGEEWGSTVTRDLVQSSPRSTLVVGSSLGTGIAVMALESEITQVPALIAAARAAVSFQPSKMVMILWVAGNEPSKSKWTTRLTELSTAMGIALEPWFAEIGDTAVVARAATDPSLGLVALAAPPPGDRLVETSSPIDDALPVAKSSILLLRDLASFESRK